MKPQGPLFAGVVLLLGLLCASHAPAQLPWRWFGSKTPDKSAPPKTTLIDPRRATEIDVEVAWLADPITFPYYLEARVNAAQQLEVRGYVPNKTVRDHALRTAHVYASMPVLDSLKEHASLLVRPNPMSPQQLQSSVQSSLKVALPKQFQQLKIECGTDGKVYVSGPVTTVEEKLAVSHSLRRLHGCTSVQNMTSVPGELARNGSPPPTGPAPAVAATPPETKSKSWFPWASAKTTTREEPPLLDPRQLPVPTYKEPALAQTAPKTVEPPLLEPRQLPVPTFKEPALAQSAPKTVEPPLLEPQKAPLPTFKEPTLAQEPPKANYPEIPLVILPVAVVKDKSVSPEPKQTPEPVKVELPVPPPPAPSPSTSPSVKVPAPAPSPPAKLAPEELQKRIQLACPKATKVNVTFTSATEVRIVIDVRAEDDVNTTTDRIFSLPELQDYRPDLQFNIGAP